MFYARTILADIEAYITSPEAVILTGMRRTGKTTIMQELFGRPGIGNKLFLDLENPLNRKYFESDNYEQIKNSCELLGLDFRTRPYIFLDEIQHVRNLPSVVKYFIDHYNVKFFLTGSASFYLKNLFSESLAGRKVIFEIFPLTFREFLTFKGARLRLPDSSAQATRAMCETISPLYDEYLRYGGFPSVVLKSGGKEKEKALEDIFTSFFQLEVLQLGHFRRNDVVRDLMLLLMQSAGSKIDIQKLSRDLNASRPAVYEYLAFLESTYFITSIRPFSTGRAVEIRKSPKVYICDVGLANHFARLDAGNLFENAVFQNLRVKGSLHYYQKKSGAEIDFILDKKIAFEVKLTPQAPHLRKLKASAEELQMERYAIISRNYSTLDHVEYGFSL